MSLGKNFFAGCQVSFTNQKNEKSRFGELSVDQMQGTMSNAVPVTTKKPQSLRLDYLTLLPAKFNSFKCCKIEIRPSRSYAFMKIM